jgi:pimeloyl-ACP methyl ester carboxylesterase
VFLDGGPGFGAISSFAVDLHFGGAVEDFSRAITACRDRLTAAGIDLPSYDSAESAAELDALRRVLGYRQWNLFAASADGVLGLTYMPCSPTPSVAP